MAYELRNALSLAFVFCYLLALAACFKQSSLESEIHNLFE